ncbi:D-isomer specific 2-hydroxyacid dehydrogenase [Chytriomyces sp. MP71]|nr:D-isomer specific 2-hydroxyacid dehydrogenase [Chytriomyces sp. MP71]
MRVVYINLQLATKTLSSTDQGPVELLTSAIASIPTLVHLSPIEVIESEDEQYLASKDLKSVHIAIVDSAFTAWRHLPSVKLICVAWAGIDKLLVGAANNPVVRQARVVRLVDPDLSERMAQSALAHTLTVHREYHTIRTNQSQKKWVRTPTGTLPIPTRKYRIVVVGMGVIGSKVTTTLVRNGFLNVAGWSTSERTLSIATLDSNDSITNILVPVLAGDDALHTLLAEADVVINILPLTEQTRGLFDFDKLKRMRRPHSAFVNLGRGATVVEEDVVKALDDPLVGLDSAILDVFRVEPLPAASPLWEHPKVIVTPHMAALTDYVNSSTVIANNIRLFIDGDENIPGTVDFSRGY